MADVFISCSPDDETAARALAETVAREGYAIAAEIGEAKAVIVIWSERAFASRVVRAEAELARQQGKLVQASLDARMPPMPFNQLHFVSIGDWCGEADHPGWTRVRESLARLCAP